MAELFDVFDEQPSNGNAGQDVSLQSRKRLANGNLKAPQESGLAEETDQAGHESSFEDQKRPKLEHTDEATDSLSEGSMDISDDETEAGGEVLSKPEARVTDAFETEQSREFLGAAGLQGKEESAQITVRHQVRHEVALPLEYDYVPIHDHKYSGEPARTWPFELDGFQKISIDAIQRNESVLVSAHTSAGKTVVAEYAIAQCFQNNQRVIYTSPIKALSNQKYREFYQIFDKDVGLMTGDITLNPKASCLVMTTEILRSMLYRGSEVMREVGWIVFDEVHYLRDKARGVVWEETIILLPDKVRYVFLSATIPNAMEFAEWVVKTHNQPCHVVYTDLRPTPLQHYLFAAGAEGMHLVVNEKGTFKEDNFNNAVSGITEKQAINKIPPWRRPASTAAGPKFSNGGKDNRPDIERIVSMIMHQKFNPVIVFSFSKKECEQKAVNLSHLAFTNREEYDLVTDVFNRAMDLLAPEDQELQQVRNILPLLQRGIGIHHSGLLPILKETIEVMFQENLLKVLFATETFSIGLNMPAKTVVFTNVRKFDGVSQRWLTSSEFIQMSGRAGRRGLDERGIVIMMIDEKMEPTVAKDIVTGEQDKLNSAFHLGYNMILNLLRVEGVSPEYMLERCFYQFQNTASVSGLEKQLRKLEAQKEKIQIEHEPAIKEHYDVHKQHERYREDMHRVMTHPNYCLQFMQIGRLVYIKTPDQDFGWGTVINCRQTDARRVPRDAKPQELHTIDTAIIIAAVPGNESAAPGLPHGVRAPKGDEMSKVEIVPLSLTSVEKISSARLHLSANLGAPGVLSCLRNSIQAVKAKCPDGLPLLDPVKDMGITDEKSKKVLDRMQALQTRLQASPLRGLANLPELLEQCGKKMEYYQKIKALKTEISTATNIKQLAELKIRKRILRRLGFTNAQDVVQLKARVACEINTGNELVLSELLFDGFFSRLSPEHCAACLSCFIFEEKAKDLPTLREDLQKPFMEIQKHARIVARVSQESKLEINEEEFVRSFKPQLMEVVYAWTKGASFGTIAKMTEVYEGNLIRLFRRLVELLRQMTEGAKAMGNEDLIQKFSEALDKVNRNMVQHNSLYT